MNNAHISIYGTVLARPVVKDTNSGQMVTMRVAVQTTRMKEGDKYPESDIYDVSVWGRQGDTILKYVDAKTKVIVHGDFMLAPWKTRDGKENTSLRVNANSVTITSGRIGESAKNTNNETKETNSDDEPF